MIETCASSITLPSASSSSAWKWHNVVFWPFDPAARAEGTTALTPMITANIAIAVNASFVFIKNENKHFE
jgi:hypothetical protein